MVEMICFAMFSHASSRHVMGNLYVFSRIKGNILGCPLFLISLFFSLSTASSPPLQDKFIVSDSMSATLLGASCSGQLSGSFFALPLPTRRQRDVCVFTVSVRLCSNGRIKAVICICRNRWLVGRVMLMCSCSTACSITTHLVQKKTREEQVPVTY